MAPSDVRHVGADETQRGRAILSIAEYVRSCGYVFTTISPASHARVNGRQGNAWASSLRDVFGWSRPFKTGFLPPEILARMLEAGIAEKHEDAWRSLIRLSTLHGQLFVHSAYPTVESNAVFFGPDTYRFAEALMAHLRLSSAPVRRAVDIGCGAGPGAILIGLAHPLAEVHAVDINDEALLLTKINASLAKAANVTARQSNLLSAVEGQFDLIISNPPYLLDASRRAYRHGGGNFGEGLSIAIVRDALNRLAPGGTLLLYTGSVIVNGTDGFLESVKKLLERQRVQWHYREIDPDVFGEELLEPVYEQADRIAAVMLTVTLQSDRLQPNQRPAIGLHQG